MCGVCVGGGNGRGIKGGWPSSREEEALLGLGRRRREDAAKGAGRLPDACFRHFTCTTTWTNSWKAGWRDDAFGPVRMYVGVVGWEKGEGARKAEIRVSPAFGEGRRRFTRIFVNIEIAGSSVREKDDIQTSLVSKS